MDPRERNRRRKLGQNDLVDPVIRERIVAAVERRHPLAGAGILEIGAGEGALTSFLLSRRPARLLALDVDPGRLERLVQKVGAAPELAIRTGDAREREVLAAALGDLPHPRRVVGSLPYNVATPIIDALLDCPLDDAHVIVQREVAERIVAAPRSREYGLLSVTTQLRAAPALLMRIPPSAFRPRPNVESALLRLVPQPSGVDDWTALHAHLSLAFGQRRKMMRNALAAPGVAEALAAAGLSPEARAEELSPAEHVRIERMLRGAAP